MPDGNTEIMKRLMENVVVHEYGVMKLNQLKEKFKAKHLPHSGLKFGRVVRLLHHDFGPVPESLSPATAYATPAKKSACCSSNGNDGGDSTNDAGIDGKICI